jgi:sodium leak channel non-selective protein
MALSFFLFCLRYSTKKKSTRQQVTTKNNLQHLNDINHHINHYNHHILVHHHLNESVLPHQQLVSNSKFIMPASGVGGTVAAVNAHQQINMVYEVHDWWQDQIISTQSSDDES